MLQRAAETVSGDDECNDPAVLLACALGSTGCPAKCAEEEGKKSTINPYEGVQAGDLNVAVSTSSSVTSIPYKGVIKVAELDVKASENIQLQSIVVSRLGLAANKGIKVWIEKDGKRISSSSSLLGDSTANLTFNNNGYVVNGNETLDLVISLDGTQTAGAELQFKVNNIVASAKSISISPDTTGVFRTTTYEATKLSVDGLNITNNYDLAEDVQFSFGEFKVINESKASDERNVLIRNITFKLEEGNFDNLGNFKLLRDSKEVSSKYTIDGKSLTFTVNDQLDSGKSATYKLVGTPTNIEKEAGDDYKFIINKDADVIAEEIGQNSSAYRVSIKLNTAANGNVLWTTKIKGGNFTLTRDKNFASTVNANWGYSDVVVAKGTFKANQAVKYENGVKIAGTVTDSANPSDVTKVVRRASLIIGSRTYQAEIYSTGLYIESEVYVDKGTHDVELQVSLQNTEVATISALKFDDISGNTFGEGRYLNTDETKAASTQIAWSIRTAKLSITAQKMWFKKNGPKEDVKVAQGNTDEKVVLEGTITNTEDKDLSISRFVLTGAKYTDNPSAGADVYVELWDRTSSRVTYSAAELIAGTAKSVDVSTVIEAGKSVDFRVYVMPNANLTAGGNFRFTVAAEGKVDWNTLTTSELKSAVISVKAGADVTTVAQTAKTKIIFPGESTEIASFDYTVKNDNAELSSMFIATTTFNTAALSDLTVKIWEIDPALSYKDATINGQAWVLATFDSLQSIPEGKYTVRVYATFEDNATAATQRFVNEVAFNPTSAYDDTDKDTHSWAVDFGTKVYHYVAKAYPVLSRESFSRDKDAPSLELGVYKIEKDGVSAIVEIDDIKGTWSGNTAETPVDLLTNPTALDPILKAASSSFDQTNIGTSKSLLRGSVQKIAVKTISFTVTVDGTPVSYSDVSADTIADFATLTNE